MLAILSTIFLLGVSITLTLLLFLYGIARSNRLELNEGADAALRNRFQAVFGSESWSTNTTTNDVIVHCLQWVWPGFFLGVVWAFALGLSAFAWAQM